MRARLPWVWMLLLCVGCFRLSALRSNAAGSIGCPTNQITIVEYDRRAGSVDYVAECGGEQFVCNTGSTPNCSPLRVVGEATESTVNEERELYVAPRRNLPSEGIGFARENGAAIGVRATLVSVDSVLRFVVAGADPEFVTLEVESHTAVPLARCNAVVIGAPPTQLRGEFSGSRSRFPLASLAESARAGARIAFCGRRFVLSEEQAQTVEHLRRAANELTTPAHESDVSPAPEPPAASDAEGVIRAQLDRAAAVLHACVGSNSPLRVEAAWADDGSVTVSTPAGGDAETRCIRAAIQIHVPPGGGTGDLVHVVQ